MSMLSDSSRLIDVCQSVGADVPRWTQGPGGNVSIKRGQTLWIKTSGVRLDQVKENSGISRVNLESLETELQNLNRNDEEGYRVLLGKHSKEGRPSMETGFHALLPGRWVIHLHSIPALIMAHHFFSESRKIRTWLKIQKLKVCVLNTLTPGLELGLSFVETGAEVWLLRNHGVVLQTAEEDPFNILKLWRQVEDDFCNRWGVNLQVENCATPLKFYFPDVAVFHDGIARVVTEAGGLFVLKQDAFTIDQNAAELFQAIQILFRECTELEEIPSEMRTALPNLPTEKIRRAV